MTEEELKAVHKHTFKNRKEVLASKQCICFYCKENFYTKDIKAWADNEQTALCPLCGIDAVIGSESGYRDPSLREEMHNRFFKTGYITKRLEDGRVVLAGPYKI